MINFLRRKFIKNYDNIEDYSVRQAHGKLASLVGVVSNLFLFLVKLISGLLIASVSVIADSVNNLSDMASSVISLIGFKLSSLPPDKEHPYGHQRVEYLGGLFVAILILLVGAALLIASIKKIIYYTYEQTNLVLGLVTLAILTLSIVLKLFQSLFNKKVGILINSTALKATAADSRNDCIATLAILIGTTSSLILDSIGIVVPFSIDGVLGVGVSLFIIISGIILIKDTANPLICECVPQEKIDEITEFILANPTVLNIHDVACHSYGPAKYVMTLHAGVNSTMSFKDAHSAIDSIEKSVKQNFDVDLTIHMDPVDVGNSLNDNLKELARSILTEFDDSLKMHDFRIEDEGELKIFFDVVKPYKCKHTSEEIEEHLATALKANGINCNLFLDFDLGEN